MTETHAIKILKDFFSSNENVKVEDVVNAIDVLDKFINKSVTKNKMSYNDIVRYYNNNKARFIITSEFLKALKGKM